MILAFDTSCYTTSLALLDDDGRLLADKRRLLPVEQGACGLRQSDALFKHTQALPALLKEALADIPVLKARVVAASTRPRPRKESYMPVFLAGEQAARLLSLAWDRPFLAFSHQEGHIAAALWSMGLDWREPFLAAHLSGGTSELLLACPKKGGLELEIVGSSDLPAGQFVDRVGVGLGLPFPAGPALEKLALGAPASSLRLKGSVKGAEMSFSGPESAAQRLIAQGTDGAALAQAVFVNIGQSLGKALQSAAKACGCKRALITGGVAANSLIRARAEQEASGLDLHFAPPAYAGDNAVGIAVLAAAERRGAAL
ncbi:MAG: O-sialoglycoprotein endopeptidase [Clostridiales bacterium]|nr:O-sialoglycoprotein endopeptidase [Clostridiales bacterium]